MKNKKETNKITRYFTPNEYVLAQIAKHPLLYASDSFEKSKFLVFSQLFNVIGNGIRDSYELNETLTFKKPCKKIFQ